MKPDNTEFWIGAFVVIAIAVIICAGIGNERMASECRARGGAYIYRDQICMRPEFVIPVDRR